MSVGLHGVELRIGAVAVLPDAILPALACPAKVTSGDDVLPFGALSASGLGADRIAAGGHIDASPGATDPFPLAATIQRPQRCLVAIMVDVLASLDLCAFKGGWSPVRDIPQGDKKQKKEQGKRLQQWLPCASPLSAYVAVVGFDPG